MSKCIDWIEKTDPYAIQRIVFYKSLIVATVAVYAYWFFLPISFIAFSLPFLLASSYESQLLSSFKEKERLLIFSFVAVLVISTCFYLINPFRVTFCFFSIATFTIVYFSLSKRFYSFRNLTMAIIAICTVFLNTQPPGNLQVAYGFISSGALAMMIIFICLRFSKKHYLIVWNRAIQKLIQCVEEEINNPLKESDLTSIQEVTVHLGIVRAYCRLVPRKYIMQAYRISIYIRSIQIALDHLYYETKNEVFWQEIGENLQKLRLSMPAYIPCDEPQKRIEQESKLHRYVIRNLQQTIIHWNKLCEARNY